MTFTQLALTGTIEVSPGVARAGATVNDESYPFPGVFGWAATFAVVVVYDVWATKTRRPTMSRTLGHYLHKPILGPVFAGAWAGLAYHLLVEERLTNLDEALIAAKSLAEITEPPSQT